MASPVTSGTSAFAFLNTSASQSSAAAGARQSSSDGGFSSVLRGQMNARPGAEARPANEARPAEARPAADTRPKAESRSNAESRPSADSAKAAPAPEKPTQASDRAQAQRAPAAEKTAEATASGAAEHAHPGKSPQPTNDTAETPDDAADALIDEQATPSATDPSAAAASLMAAAAAAIAAATPAAEASAHADALIDEQATPSATDPSAAAARLVAAAAAAIAAATPAAEASAQAAAGAALAKPAPSGIEKPTSGTSAVAQALANQTTATVAKPAPALAAQPAATIAMETAAAAAASGNNLAGLPAAIAALLPGLVTRQATASTISGDHAEISVGVETGAELALAGDSKGKSLQNPAGVNTRGAQNPGLSAQLTAGDQADAQSSADGSGDETGIDLLAQQAPGIAKPKVAANAVFASVQTQAANLLQVKPEMSAGSAEQPLMTQTIAEDSPLGTQGTVLQALRAPSQLQAAVPQLAVATAAGQAGWANEVGNRVMWMVGRAESKAELVLTPPNLGKVEVSINLNGDQTTAQFVAATQSARDALEQAMPRLRELLAQSGISLGQTGVSTSGEQQTHGDERSRGGNGGNGSAGGIQDGEAGAAAPWVRQTEGLVDTFA